MLNNYYYFGLGNDTEGYTLLSGQNLETAFLYSDYFLTVNQFFNRDYSDYFPHCPIFYIKQNGQQISGKFDNVNQWSENLTTDVNAIFHGVYKRTSRTGEPIERFDKKNMFILSSSLDLVKTSNHLIKFNQLNYSSYPYWQRNEAYRLIVQPDLKDLTIVESKSQNVYEFFDQCNITSALIDNALTGTIWRDWRGKTMNFPISNYGKNLPTSSIIYKLNNALTSYPPFFGLSGDFSYSNNNYTEDVYVCSNEYTFSPYTGINYSQHLNELSGFTLYDQKYILSGVNNIQYSTLYKKDDKYIPIKCNTTNKLCDTNVNFYMTALGRFNILSGEAGLYMNKMHNYFTSQNMYKFGEWLSGLQYVSTFGSNISGVNFNVQPLSRSKNNDIYYLALIGIKNRYNYYPTQEYNYTQYYDTSNYTNTIQGSNTQEFYIAIDPQTYSISL